MLELVLTFRLVDIYSYQNVLMMTCNLQDMPTCPQRYQSVILIYKPSVQSYLKVACDQLQLALLVVHWC